MLARFNVEKLNNENRKSNIASPSSWGHSKQDLLLHQESYLIGDFFHKPTWTMSGHLQKRFFDCCKLDRRLARTWHNPSNELKGESVAGTLLAERQNPAQAGGTDLAKAWNPAEPSGAAEPSGTRRNPAEPGETRRNPAEPGGTRRNPAEPGGTRRKPGGKKIS